ncbi:MAG: ABC transporter permease [Bryobacterales bacterium]|nr:ABC transporter permease [Bryobacterales bacterium]
MRFREELAVASMALRRLWRNRTISLLVAFSLALGIGANTAIFTLVDAVLLAPLPVREPGRLFSVFTADARIAEPLPVSFPNYLDLRGRSQAFGELAAFTWTKVNLAIDGEVREHTAEVVTDNYFVMAGVQPALGRLPDAGDDDAPLPAVLSYPLWRKQFRGEEAVIGKMIHLNRQAFRVAAVMPASFKGLERVGSTDLWIPMRACRAVLEMPGWVDSRRAVMFLVAGRLRDGIPKEWAAAEADRVGRELASRYPLDNAGRSFSIAPLDAATEGPMRRKGVVRAAVVLMSASGLVLLIAIASAGNMLLSRSSVRRREMAVRLALGATRRKLLYQVFLDSALLVVIGSALGLLFGVVGRELLWRFRPEHLSVEDLRLGINGRVLAFTALVSVLTGIAASLLPALQSLRGEITGELREGARARLNGWKSLHLREALVVGQVALSLVALVGADLFLKSLRNMRAIDPGFDTRTIASFSVNPRRLGLGDCQRLDFYASLREKLAGIGGVQSVSISSNPLLGESSVRRTVQLPGNSGRSGEIVPVNMVSTRYFETADVLILRGRDFTSGDGAGTAKVAIVNETMARRFWPGAPAIGKTFRFFGDDDEHTVIGVARDGVYNALGERPEPYVYVPLTQSSPSKAFVLVRAAGDPARLAGNIAAEMKRFRPDLPAVEVTPIRTSIEESLWAPRMGAGLLAVFGLLALALASVGVYGVTAQMISRRTGEMGVRMAMGACPVDVMELVLRQCFTLILPGLALGSVAAFVLARFCFQNLLYGVSEMDLEPYLAASVLLAVVALAASYLPARRALGLQPLTALREQ